MSEGNTPGEVVSATTGDPRDIELAELRAKLAELTADKVARPVFDGEIPRYEIISPAGKGVFLEDDTLHARGEVIDYLGTPNLEMLPLNAAAKERMREYIEHLTAGARAAAEVFGRPFRRLEVDPGTVIATALQDARRDAGNMRLGNTPHLVMPVDRGEVPQMPHTDEAIAKRRGRPSKASKVVGVTPPAPPGKQAPKPVSVIGRDNGYLTSGS